MTPETVGFRFEAAILVLFLTLGSGHSEYRYDSAPIERPLENVSDARNKIVAPIHKALLTQRGYIQFLRWELPVPEIEEFTFCVWVKSTNLTYPHSIFSYSKNEKDRLVRAWISPQGQSLHLEIDNVEIFEHPTRIREHHWHHICQSWDNLDGRYALWVDGQKEIDGYAAKMEGHVIPSNGDIVLGQEYTDFDKGLEEGVEGAVLGFNLILSSAFETSRPYFERNKLDDIGLEGEIDLIAEEADLSDSMLDRSGSHYAVTGNPVFSKIPLAPTGNFKPRSASHRSPDVEPRVLRTRHVAAGDIWRTNKPYVSGDWKNDGSGRRTIGEKPLGQQLVEISFEHCQLGRGSPNIGGKLMLVSWTRTPVKVFGGAIIKNANSVCGNF